MPLCTNCLQFKTRVVTNKDDAKIYGTAIAAKVGTGAYGLPIYYCKLNLLPHEIYMRPGKQHKTKGKCKGYDRIVEWGRRKNGTVSGG